MSRSIMRFAPKTHCFSRTMSLSTRIATAVSINSIGHLRFYHRVFAQLGLPRSDHCDRLFIKLDRRFDLNRTMRRLAKVKRVRANRKKDKWRLEQGKKRKDRLHGKLYATSIGVEEEARQPADKSSGKVPKRQLSKVCRSGSTTHSRVSNFDCGQLTVEYQLQKGILVRLSLSTIFQTLPTRT
jgi:hypothetical protein